MAVLTRGKSFLDSLITGDTTLKNIFSSKSGVGDTPHEHECSPSDTRKWIKELSALANVVVGHCARILLLHPEELQRHFEEEAPASAKDPSKYALHLLEYSCFRALSVQAQVTDHLSDKEFRRLTFDMMLAWETPGAADKPVLKCEPETSTKESRSEDEEDSALFYSDLMSLMVDVESTVGLNAFARIAPALHTVADSITVHSQFDALTANTGGRLPFPIFDKYVAELDKSIKAMKNQATPALVKALQLGKNEKLIDTDGTATTQPVLQHVGVSTWPGRLTLTDHAIYFEATGVVSYDKPKKFDLSADLKHIVKPVLTGPWGARLFDKAVMYKSSALVDPVVLEFPELKGRSRRDYWLAIIREVMLVHQFIRTYQLEGVGKAEALAKAVLGIARLRATKETFHVLPPRPESLLTYSLGAEMPGGDFILAELANSLCSSGRGEGQASVVSVLDKYQDNKIHAISAAAIGDNFRLLTPKGAEKIKEAPVSVGEILIGETTPLEKAILQSRDNNKKVLEAQATIEGVKVDGIGTNSAVLQELVIPLTAVMTWLQSIYLWEEPLKSITFCVIGCYIIFNGWVAYWLPLSLLLMAAYMAYVRRMRDEAPIKEVLVPSPPNQSTVEQLIALQQALTQLEALIQAGNIFLLKTRALVLSALPEATNQVIAILVGVAAVLLIFPTRWLILATFVNVFTLEMPTRAESTRRFTRRINEWWYSIPVVPVRFLKPESDNGSK
ncbi:uncharacterized protein [Physcomitrium patens]|uniref:Uncharacterized protein n=2 Tax=Physcomitrium patens TaxID=3218 RepID=A0A2K1JTM3_PHYPA|nr:uncharacterized protein LOC112289010 isoform X2 [Physcomitrium patens]XP_024389636.1 uncharacterized protein LOC112289010 isoform X2 [Physcomitrium patens]XP_024389637.1 uncharacterized protein LOC112289010 isoform X2 [Physcomitrium patens]XP_024389639.1 uncharacterized protein LOC112289010 isoform X2 [Physcomitrium patens]XP_024389640.1 uncharacterized protein LOC112289010 isoform X2 [Physcomitrium patens]PNR44883.1 hypothetical protein PHYPA_014653 [Physcomitrium patens]|eukprot:XP_024389635.1 uncharacterized protein LOC112289010 isoform X2 [Physcomitrella patens]